MSIDLDDKKIAHTMPPIFRLAFRPFFLVGTLFSFVAIGWWVYFWTTPLSWAPYGGAIWWHGHEMLFGFGAAIVTGFLLTAVKNWTGVAGLNGRLLAILFTLWLAGRLVISFRLGLNDLYVAIIDVAFLIFTAIAMLYPIFKVRQWKNLMFVPILLALALLNTMSHWAIQTQNMAFSSNILHAVVLLFVLIIAILGGRVIPAFTANATGKPKKAPFLLLEVVSFLSLLLLISLALLGFDNVDSKLLLGASIVATIANGWRFFRWGFQHTLKIPLLWSLHLSFLFVPIGCFLLALFAIEQIVNLSAAIHSFTVGSIGGMILAMISRVTLGHTGRRLLPPRAMTIAFVFIALSALVRMMLPLWLPALYNWTIVIAGAFWLVAYGLFLLYYFPMLIAPRVDGKPG